MLCVGRKHFKRFVYRFRFRFQLCCCLRSNFGTARDLEAPSPPPPPTSSVLFTALFIIVKQREPLWHAPRTEPINIVGLCGVLTGKLIPPRENTHPSGGQLRENDVQERTAELGRPRTDRVSGAGD